jgi:hypothetical protein
MICLYISIYLSLYYFNDDDGKGNKIKFGKINPCNKLILPI